MKAPHAFRSISEVADMLAVRQHTLRAWEDRFPFVKPVKRPDGRRYYRPTDVKMLAELHRLLTQKKLSTEAILLLYRQGGLAEKAPPRVSRQRLLPLRDHIAALSAARRRLADLLT